MQKLKMAEGHLEDEKKMLRIALDDVENRMTKSELTRRALEGDLQRLRLCVTDKETENQVGRRAGRQDDRRDDGRDDRTTGGMMGGTMGRTTGRQAR